MSARSIAGLYLAFGCMVVFVKLHRWEYLHRLTWRDSLALAVVVVLWPVLVVF